MLIYYIDFLQKKGFEMSKTITGDNIKKLINELNVIEGGELKNCGSIKYDFTISGDILKADFNLPINIDSLPVEKRSNAIVKPGEVVYVLSEENINMPNNMYMTLSANRSMSESGILTLGGFAVDPGYSGRLMFGLYNYSSTNFTIIPGEKLVGGVFYEFEGDEILDISEIENSKSIDKFPPKLVNIIRNYMPTGLSSLNDSVKVIKDQVDEIKRELKDTKNDFSDLENLIQKGQKQLTELNDKVDNLTDNIEKISLSVKSLTNGLQDEIKLRESLSNDLDVKFAKQVQVFDKKFAFVKGVFWCLSSLVGVVIFIITALLKGWLNFNF